MAAKKQNTYNFMFAHLVVREVLFRYRANFVNVMSKDLERTEAFFNEMWEKQKTDPELYGCKDGVIKVNKAAFDDGTELIIAELPEPNQDKEVLYIGVTLTENMRYFVFERTFSPEYNGILWEVAEWRKKADDKFEHVHLAITNNRAQNAFIALIDSVRKG